ncbi:hypothetical protein SHIRM173S_06312 [Streptomyces hirsutus]
MLFVGPGVLGVEEACCVVGWQGEGEVAEAGVVGGAGGGGEAEPGAGFDDQAGTGGRLLPGLGADTGLPSGAHRILQASGEVGAGPADLVFHVPLHGALGDAERVGHRAGALELPDQVAPLRPADLGMGRVNASCAAASMPSLAMAMRGSFTPCCRLGGMAS